MSNLARNASRGAVWQAVSQLCLTASGYVVAVVLARALGPVDFGLYGVVYSLLMALELTVVLGLPGAVSRLISLEEEDQGQLGRSALTLVLLCALAALALLWVAAPWMRPILPSARSVELFRIAIIDIPCFATYHLIAHVLNGRRDFVTQSIGNILYSASRVLGLAGLYLADALSVEGALWVNVLASLVGLAVVARKSGVGVFAPSFARAPSLLKLAGPMALISVGSQLLLYIDLWSINMFGGAGDADTGLYVAAKNLARIPNLISFVLMAVLMPSIGKARALGDLDSVGRLTRGTTRFLAVTLLPGCALMAIEAPAIMDLMFSSTYVGGAPYLSVLVVANGLFHTLAMTGISVMIATDRQKTAVLLALGGAAAGIVLNAWLVPRFGAMGAAAGVTLASAGVALGAAGVIRVEVGRLFEDAVLPRAMAVTILVCGVSYLIEARGLAFVFEIAAMLLAVAVLSGALRIVTLRDLMAFRGKPGASAVS